LLQLALPERWISLAVIRKVPLFMLFSTAGGVGQAVKMVWKPWWSLFRAGKCWVNISERNCSLLGCVLRLYTISFDSMTLFKHSKSATKPGSGCDKRLLHSFESSVQAVTSYVIYQNMSSNTPSPCRKSSSARKTSSRIYNASSVSHNPLSQTSNLYPHHLLTRNLHSGILCFLIFLGNPVHGVTLRLYLWLIYWRRVEK